MGGGVSGLMSVYREGSWSGVYIKGVSGVCN